MSKRAYTVYRLFSEEDELLYVGTTCKPTHRFVTHEATKEWWPQVTYMRLQHYPTKPEAFLAEWEAIQSEKPAYNIQLVKPLPNRLYELRLRADVHRRELAEEFDVPETRVERWERVGPPRDYIPQLARRFDVSVDYLMGWDQERAA